ncbi:hypothetical protein PF005_g18038 [Phytophthora fragariae]|uniref:Uncharacterized protein n=1 Tax=Phytophthora fragariae TaxID=53985 RepID=A0A6A3X6Z9_9STRA|nr:hypothetical protein PF009_g18208 [Phytophthora fragariae]KAE8971666.1 hypothetical protein PF011_g25950 [Phytophthora fragariae]KAE9069310.1 hypothetical protein PF010_g26713 [Phytophthora fragariae]KAE9176181.1 hypothetical protein PF004_g26168 [Phytophthora fragariae]KAE9193513.1 hypothetical protein PF005_g18038 [Phytophthora fragariae]
MTVPHGHDSGRIVSRLNGFSVESLPRLFRIHDAKSVFKRSDVSSGIPAVLYGAWWETHEEWIQ